MVRFSFRFVDLVKESFVFSIELHGTTGHPKLTVGKLYAMALYIDNYRSYKQGHSNDTGVSQKQIENNFFFDQRDLFNTIF